MSPARDRDRCLPDHLAVFPDARTRRQVAQERQGSLQQQGGGPRVVRGQRVVGEVVVVAGIEEQFCVLGLGHQGTRGVDIALVDEYIVGVDPVNLHRHAVRCRSG